MWMSHVTREWFHNDYAIFLFRPVHYAHIKCCHHSSYKQWGRWRPHTTDIHIYLRYTHVSEIYTCIWDIHIYLRYTHVSEIYTCYTSESNLTFSLQFESLSASYLYFVFRCCVPYSTHTMSHLISVGYHIHMWHDSFTCCFNVAVAYPILRIQPHLIVLVIPRVFANVASRIPHGCRTVIRDMTHLWKGRLNMCDKTHTYE